MTTLQLLSVTCIGLLKTLMKASGRRLASKILGYETISLTRFFRRVLAAHWDSLGLLQQQPQLPQRLLLVPLDLELQLLWVLPQTLDLFMRRPNKLVRTSLFPVHQLWLVGW